MHTMIDLCFMCSNENKCNIVDNKIVTQVEYLMPEITIVKLRLPLRFCSICEHNLQLFSTFKKDCVENSLRLEAWIKEAQDNTDETENYPTSEININKMDEVCIKEEALDDIDNLEVKYPLIEEIFIKDDPISENPSGYEFDNLRQEILKEESAHRPEDNSIDMDDESDQNSDDPDDEVSDNNEINFDDNILVTDSTGRTIYTCLICKKDFKHLKYLKYCHMKVHTGKQDFQCNECKKWFIHKSHLVTHMIQHTGIKDYQCNQCQKWFSRKSVLLRHIKEHTGIKDFQCNECKKWFLQKSHLIVHMKQHTGVKDYQCNECKKWFSRKSHLVRHMKKHNAGKK